MKRKIEESIKMPEGVNASFQDNVLKVSKDSSELSKSISLPGTSISVDSGEIKLVCEKGNKRDLNRIRSVMAHIGNMIAGVLQPFVYEMESANVHFPMTIKVEGENLAITNFLGEKKPRFARIISGVDVQVKGNNITVTSPSLEDAGQTAANFEKATRVKNRDPRIFQDGIYITKKPKRREVLQDA